MQDTYTIYIPKAMSADEAADALSTILRVKFHCQENLVNEPLYTTTVAGCYIDVVKVLYPPEDLQAEHPLKRCVVASFAGCGSPRDLHDEVARAIAAVAAYRYAAEKEEPVYLYDALRRRLAAYGIPGNG